MLSAEEQRELDELTRGLPTRRAAAIDALRLVQRHRGWVSDEAIRDLAGALETSVEDLDGVATFYNLIYRRPVGRHVILLCDSVSCWIVGYRALRRRLEERLGIGFGETTDDGRFTLLPIACLGACDGAPALMIDEDLHRDLTPERLDEILGRYE